MANEAANGPWQDEVREFTAGGEYADEGAMELEEYFYLGDDRPSL
jgi:hypothetical protein